MILTDHKLKDYGQKLVAPFAGDRVQAVGYDLTAKTFLLSSEQASSEVTLEPMASVFVQCEEEIALPADITSTIQLRNSRIRQGLILTQNLGFRSCRRRRKTVDLLVAQANPGHSRG